jgi:hypothetical protein
MGPRRFFCCTATIILLLVTAAPGLPAQAGGLMVRLDALVGFNGTAREGRFAPVILSVENPGARMQAEISLQLTWGSAFRSAPAGQTIRRDVVLDAGSTRRIPFLVPIPRSVRMLRATVSSKGVTAGSLDLELRPLTTTSRIIAGISSELSLDGLSALPGSAGSLRVVYPRVDDLPVSWAGYDAVDAVIVHDTSFQQLRSDQVAALERWVVTGGILVFTGGAAALQHAPAGFGRLLPVEITGLAQASGRTLVSVSGGRVPVIAGRIELAESRLKQGRIMAGEGNLPLIVERRLGRGSIWFLAFDPTMPPVSTWAGALPMWRSILSGDRVPAMGAAPREPLADPWIAALLAVSPASFPPVPALLVFISAYLGLLAPLVVIRPGRGLRPRFRLLLIFVLSVSTTFAGWAVFSVALFRPGLQVLDAARVEARSGDGFARVTEKAAVFASASQQVEVRLASTDAAIEAAGFRIGTADAAITDASLVIMEKGSRTTIRGLDVQRLDARLLVIQDVVPLEVIFRAETSGSALTAVVTNGARQPLTGCVILKSGRAYPIGDIAPGATVRRSFDAAEGVEPLEHGTWLQGGDPRRAGLWKAEAEEADQGHAPAQLIGWMDGPVLPLTFPGGSWFGGRPGLALLRVEAE